MDSALIPFMHVGKTGRYCSECIHQARQERLLQCYRKISRELLQREDFVLERSGHGDFEKVNLDIRVLVAVRRLIARFVQLRSFCRNVRRILKTIPASSNYSLVEPFLSNLPRRYFQLSFSALSQDFTLKLTEDLAGKRESQSMRIEAPFTWKSESYQRPTRNVLWQAMGFTLEFYDDFVCPITQKHIDEIDDPCFDDAPNVYERADLMTWLSVRNTNPATRKKMTVRNILELPRLKEKWDEFYAEEPPLKPTDTSSQMAEKKRQKTSSSLHWKPATRKGRGLTKPVR